MKIISFEVENFGSYKKLEMDLTDKGLVLIHGPTGCGKSTIMDAITWCLYGKTAKEVNSNDVIGWESEFCAGRVTVHVGGGDVLITVTRVRGNRCDLQFTINEGVPIRGKDLNDTQKQIDDYLGASFDRFINSAYSHEFGNSAKFFTSSAKERRSLLESIVDLSVPKKIQDKCSDRLSTLRKEIKELDLSARSLEGQQIQLKKSKAIICKNNESWRLEQSERIIELENLYNNFDKIKQSEINTLSTKLEAAANKILDLEDSLKTLQKNFDSTDFDVEINQIQESNRCNECGGVKQSAEPQVQAKLKAKERQQRLDGKIQSVKDQIEANGRLLDNIHQSLEKAKAVVNTYDNQLKQEKSKISPFKAQMDRVAVDCSDLESLIKTTDNNKKVLCNKEYLLEKLQEISSSVRSQIVDNCIKAVQDRTNGILEKYFDSEFQIEFEAKDGDKVNVSVRSGCNQCSFLQLSRGQRRLLQLSFTIACMEAASNHLGMHSNVLFFDEFLDGLDDHFKRRAHALLEELSANHSTILVIDHSEEFKTCFDSKIEVSRDAEGYSHCVEN